MRRSIAGLAVALGAALCPGASTAGTLDVGYLLSNVNVSPPGVFGTSMLYSATVTYTVRFLNAPGPVTPTSGPAVLLSFQAVGVGQTLASEQITLSIPALSGTGGGSAFNGFFIGNAGAGTYRFGLTANPGTMTAAAAISAGLAHTGAILVTPPASTATTAFLNTVVFSAGGMVGFLGFGLGHEVSRVFDPGLPTAPALSPAGGALLVASLAALALAALRRAAPLVQ